MKKVKKHYQGLAAAQFKEDIITLEGKNPDKAHDLKMRFQKLNAQGVSFEKWALKDTFELLRSEMDNALAK